jgi:hypothetical protein
LVLSWRHCNGASRLKPSKTEHAAGSPKQN